MMFTINGWLALVAVLLLPLSGIIGSIAVKKSQKYFVDNQEILGKINSHVEEIYSGHNVIRAFGAGKKAEEKFVGYNDGLYEASWKSQSISGVINPAFTFLANAGYVIIAVLGAFFTVRGEMTPGEVFAFIQYIRLYSAPIGQITQISGIIQSTTAAAERVFAFLEEADAEQRLESQKLSVKDAGVVFENVSFSYDGRQTVLNDFSVNVKNGERIAIVGHTGAGKSTVIKLLMKYYSPTEGRILIGGRDIAGMDTDGFRKNVSLVMQDSWLFNDTVKENIRYGNMSADDEAVKQAAKNADAHDFIIKMPDGYDTVINENTTNLSKGQKQLLCIARAILSESKIVILDEATSSLDINTEKTVQGAMEKLLRHKTCFIIAHRLSTILKCDRIIVMAEGRIAEIGSHDQLVKAGGVYAGMYNKQ